MPGVARNPRQDAATSLSAAASRTAFVLFDAVALNVLFFFALKELLFADVGYGSVWRAVAFGLLFVALFAGAGRIDLWGARQRPWSAAAQLAGAAVFAFVVYRIAQITPNEVSETEFSWVRVEFIKTPLWLRMHVARAPIFAGSFAAATAALVFASLRRPRSRILPIAVGGAALFFFARVVSFFAGVGDYGFFYLLFFAGPQVFLALLFCLRSYRLAFRLTPLALHMTLIFLFYVGDLPRPARTVEFERLPGVSRLYPPPGGHAKDLMFPRNLAVTPADVYLTYGPMGITHLVAIDRLTGRSRTARFAGLIRDLHVAPDGNHLWTINWQSRDFQALDPQSLNVRCTVGLAPFGLFTPWNLAVSDDKIYVSNVTFPIVAEFAYDNLGEQCRLASRRQLNLRQTGYTRFTDGAFGLYWDKELGKLYATTGMLDGKYLTSLIEIDPRTFAVARDVRMPGGIAMEPVEGARTVLIPSYYDDSIFEISLTEMRTVRAIKAVENLMALKYDKRRGLIYAVSKNAGELAVIDYATGKVLIALPVGARAGAMAYEKETDSLWIASGQGVFRLDLPRFLAGVIRPH